MHLAEIKEVKELADFNEVNTHLREGWVFIEICSNAANAAVIYIMARSMT
jgi:hypothetical protein